VEPKENDNAKVRYSPITGVLTPSVQPAYSASILAVLRRFQYDISSFNGEKVHSLTNVMTMEKSIHDAFDRLDLYFEATVSWVLHSPNQALIRYLFLPGCAKSLQSPDLHQPRRV
jgi:hypothetical protein